MSLRSACNILLEFSCFDASEQVEQRAAERVSLKTTLNSPAVKRDGTHGLRTELPMSDTVFTTIGYLDEGDSNLLTSGHTVDDKGGGSRRWLYLVPRFSLDIVNGSKTVVMTQDEPGLSQLMSLLFNMWLGARVATPSIQNVYLGRPIKTFFSAYHLHQFSYDVKNAVDLCAVYNYMVNPGQDEKRGVLERVYREYRYFQGTLAKNLLDAIDSDNVGDTEYRFGPHDPFEERNLVADKSTVSELSDAIRNERDALAYLDGIAMMCSYHDHIKSRAVVRTASNKACYTQLTGPLKEVDYMPPTEFATSDVTQELMKIGDACMAKLYVIKDFTNDIIDAFDEDGSEFIYSNELRRFNGKDDDDPRKRADDAASHDDDDDETDADINAIRIDGVSIADTNAMSASDGDSSYDDDAYVDMD